MPPFDEREFFRVFDRLQAKMEERLSLELRAASDANGMVPLRLARRLTDEHRAIYSVALDIFASAARKHYGVDIESELAPTRALIARPLKDGLWPG